MVVGGATVVVGGAAVVVGGGQPFFLQFSLFPSLSLERSLALVNKQGDVAALQLTNSQ